MKLTWLVVVILNLIVPWQARCQGHWNGATQELMASAADDKVTSQALRSIAAAPRKCKKLLWFTAIGGMGRHVTHYHKFLRVAMMSRQESAPSLIPHLIYDSINNSFVPWYRSMGGTVHYHKLSFYDKLQAAVKQGRQAEAWLSNTGAYLRLDLPLIVPEVEVDPDEVETRFVLYTDTDVLFMKDINSCSVQAPSTIAMGPEWTKGLKMNSGVMFINMKALTRDLPQLIAWGEQQGWPGLYDQTIITSVYGDRLQLLPDNFNWKPYWGRTQGMVIIHYHGPKPERCLDCMVLHSINQKPLDKCRCPAIYSWLWSIAPDGGKFYEDVLLQYYMYLLRSFETPGKDAKRRSGIRQ